MKNICYVSALALLISFCGNAQLNEYKYVIVPTKLEGFNKENQHNTSTLLKHLFAKANYNVMYENALTEDLKTNGCLGLKANLEDNSSLFVTKVNIVVENCNGQKVFTSKEGKSKKKEFKAAYSEAIRKAFSSFEELNYAYSPKKESSNDEPIADSFKNDGKAMETNGNTQSNPKKSELKTVVQEATTENQSYKDIAPVASNIKSATSKILYAQEIPDGFQLVDSTPKIEFKLTKTSVEDVFLATHGDINGVVLKKGDKWVFEYKENGQKILRELNIKF